MTKLGLALSGASTRSTFYIGFLQRSKELGIKYDIVCASSGASIAAAAYGIDALESLYELLCGLPHLDVRGFLTRSKVSGGIWSMETIDEFLRGSLDHKTFHDSEVLLKFLAVDLFSGQLEVLDQGDLVESILHSCTVPFLFAPDWNGDKVYLDGGLRSLAPVELVRQSGADKVVAIDMQGTPHVFSTEQVWLRKMIRSMKSSWSGHDITTGDKLIPRQELSALGVLGRAMDIAIDARNQDLRRNELGLADLVITPPKFEKRLIDRYLHLHLFDLSTIRYWYQLGRQYADSYADKITSL